MSDDDSLDAALGEMKKAAKDLARGSSRLARRLLSKAEVAAKDPRGSVKKAARTAARELESAARDIDEILKKL
jgi:hypothetical protein